MTMWHFRPLGYSKIQRGSVSVKECQKCQGVAETKLLSTMLHWNKSESGQREINPWKTRTQNGMLHPPASPWMIWLELPEGPTWSKVSTPCSGQVIWGANICASLQKICLLHYKRRNALERRIKTLWNSKCRAVLNPVSQHSLLCRWDLGLGPCT